MIRLFDETLAIKVAGAFAMPTISTSQVAAPAFIAAATGRKVYQGFQLAGQYVHLTDLTICPTGQLVGPDRRRDPGRQADQHRHAPGADGVNVNPDPDIVLGTGRHDPGHRPDGTAPRPGSPQSEVRAGRGSVGSRVRAGQRLSGRRWPLSHHLRACASEGTLRKMSRPKPCLGLATDETRMKHG